MTVVFLMSHERHFAKGRGFFRLLSHDFIHETTKKNIKKE